MMKYNLNVLHYVGHIGITTLVVCIFLGMPDLQAKLRIVTSVKPVHSLVSAITGEDQKLIVSSNVSPHAYRLRPSDARAIEAADVIIWLGPSFESFLKKPLENLPQDAQVITLMEAPGLSLLVRRSGALFKDTHNHDHDGDHADHADHINTVDLHIWLDPENVSTLADFLAKRLAELDPNGAESYSKNAAQFKAKILRMADKIKAQFSAVQHKPFLLSHDATLYFERYFGLEASGSITLSPEINPGARRIRELRAHVAKLKGSVCIFSEPGLRSSLPQLVSETGRDVHTGLIDPVGVEIPEGADHIQRTFLKLSRSFLDCFQKRN